MFEENRHKDPPWRCYLLSRPQHQNHPNVALGLPPMKSMFKTPNPTPPSSLEASPCDSPLFPVPRHVSNDTWLSVQRRTMEDYGVTGSDEPPETLVFDFSAAAVNSNKSKNAGNISDHCVTKKAESCKYGHNVTRFEAISLKPKTGKCKEEMEATGKPEPKKEQKILSHIREEQHNENTQHIVMGKPLQAYSPSEDTPCSESTHVTHKAEPINRPIGDSKKLPSLKLSSPPEMSLCDKLWSKSDIGSDKRTDPTNNKKTRTKSSTQAHALTPGMARRNGLTRRFSDLDSTRYTCDDTLVLYFRSCKSGPTSPCDGYWETE